MFSCKTFSRHVETLKDLFRNMLCFFIFENILKNPHLKLYLLMLERSGEREGGRNIDVGNIDQLPPVHALTGD